MAWESHILSCLELPWKAQHCPGSIPPVNASAGELFVLEPWEKMFLHNGEISKDEENCHEDWLN
jgi:hypothetical protein